MIRRPPRSTLSSSSAASDVYKRRVQRGEVVVVELHLRALGDLVAEADEDVLDLAHRLADEVLVAGREGPAGKGDVEALVLERIRERRLLELGLAPLDQGLQIATHHVAG